MPYFFKWALVKVTVRQTNYIWSSLAVTFSQIHLSSKESYIFIAYQSLYWTVGKHSKLLLIGQMLLTDAYLYPAAGGPSITALGGSVGSAITAKAIIPLLLGNLICVYLFIFWMDFIFMLWQFLLTIFKPCPCSPFHPSLPCIPYGPLGSEGPTMPSSLFSSLYSRFSFMPWWFNLIRSVCHPPISFKNSYPLSTTAKLHFRK